MIDNEYKTYMYTLKNVNPYPKGGSNGMYLGEIGNKLKSSGISNTAFRLFILISGDINEYNQSDRTRRELCKVLDIKYDARRIGKLLKELVDGEWIAIFSGKTLTVNPFLVMPSIKEVKMKSALQEAWRDMVEFFMDTHYDN